jgi:hypothetical protein
MLQREIGEYSNETLVSLGPTGVLPKLTLPQSPPAPRRRSLFHHTNPLWEQFPNTPPSPDAVVPLPPSAASAVTLSAAARPGRRLLAHARRRPGPPTSMVYSPAWDLLASALTGQPPRSRAGSACRRCPPPSASPARFFDRATARLLAHARDLLPSSSPTRPRHSLPSELVEAARRRRRQNIMRVPWF